MEILTNYVTMDGILTGAITTTHMYFNTARLCVDYVVSMSRSEGVERHAGNYITAWVPLLTLQFSFSKYMTLFYAKVYPAYSVVNFFRPLYMTPSPGL